MLPGKYWVLCAADAESVGQMSQQGYADCFVSAFAEDLEVLRESGGNSKLISSSIQATENAFGPMH